jgi:hypothetical protein
MAGVKYVLLVAKDGKGGVITHPETIEYPEKKKMGPRWFRITDRWRTVDGGHKARVYTEEGFSLNIDDFADPVEDNPVDDSTEQTVAAFTDLDEIFGEDSIFTDMVIEWHNKYLGQRLSK